MQRVVEGGCNAVMGRSAVWPHPNQAAGNWLKRGLQNPGMPLAPNSIHMPGVVYTRFISAMCTDYGCQHGGVVDVTYQFDLSER